MDIQPIGDSALAADSAADDGHPLHYYRQPGGCIELSQVDIGVEDIIHVCGVDKARLLIAELTEFVDACEARPVTPPDKQHL